MILFFVYINISLNFLDCKLEASLPSNRYCLIGGILVWQTTFHLRVCTIRGEIREPILSEY